MTILYYIDLEEEPSSGFRQWTVRKHCPGLYSCMIDMILLWLNHLRPSFSRQGTFHWFATVILALILQKRPQGTIQSYMNVFHLDKKYYTNLDDMFRSDAIDLDKLTDNWFNIISNECTPILFRGRRIFITDGVKPTPSANQHPQPPHS